MRVQLGETYRTLLGPLPPRDRPLLLGPADQDEPELDAFRELFGDERADYDEARASATTRTAPPRDWPARFVSSYASMHPWEDWAETWAHYLHMVDTLETARAYGLSLRPSAGPRPQTLRSTAPAPRPALVRRSDDAAGFR